MNCVWVRFTSIVSIGSCALDICIDVKELYATWLESLVVYLSHSSY
jgi:hypothetical protein